MSPDARRAARVGDRHGTAGRASPARTPTPTTARCSATALSAPSLRVLIDAGLADVRLADLGAAAHRRRRGWGRCEPTSARSTSPRPAAHRHRPARGERRHGQDLDDRRAGDAVRRRGRTPSSSRCWSSRSAGPRARSSASGCAPSWSRPSGCSATTRRRSAALDDGPTSPLVLLLRGVEAERRRRPPPGDRGAGRLRRRDHRDHPPVLLDGARLARRRRRHRLARPAGRGPRRPGQGDRRRPLPPRLRPRRERRRLHLHRGAGDRARARSTTRRPGSSPPTEDRSTPVRPPGRLRARRRAPSSTGASAGSGSFLRRPAHPARRRAARLPTAPAARGCASAGSIVLVDEFQDTDPVQWEVLDRAFTGHATMVLIGDPKQAIYAFRGGDVVTYLAGRRDRRDHRQTLSVNWRSDAAAARRLRRAARRRRARRPADRRAPGRRRTTRAAGSPGRRSPRRCGCGSCAGPTSGKRRRRAHRRRRCGRTIAHDLARDVRRLLASGATFDGARAAAARRRGASATAHADLADAAGPAGGRGVPAVIAGGGSVFATPAAVEWLALLEALEQPHRSARVRSAALTCFVGRTAAQLDARRRRPHRRGRRDAARLGRAVPRRAAWPPSSRPRRSTGCRRGCWPRSTASGG